MLNHIDITGRCVAKPDLRMTQNQKHVTTFTIACERDFSPTGEQKQTDFIDIVAYNGTAEFASKWFDKGSMMSVSGRLQIRTWEDREGNKRKSAEILASNIYFAGSKPAAMQKETFTEVKEEGELPF